MANTWTTLLDAVYPVGAVYQSWSSTSPATLFGGTWTQISGYFLRACESDEEAGATGGAKSHAHEAGELSAAVGSCNGDITTIGFDSTSVPSSHIRTPTYVVHGSVTTGGYFSHYTSVYGLTEFASNYPPHTTCYTWRRTA